MKEQVERRENKRKDLHVVLLMTLLLFVFRPLLDLDLRRSLNLCLTTSYILGTF
jgi:hypothetical protein